MMIAKRTLLVFLFSVLFILPFYSQGIAEDDTAENHWLNERVRPAPESVFKMFREAGMDPVNHVLTDSEMDKLHLSFSLMPASYQRILKEHLHSISFMDNMPNTALTSPVETIGTDKKFNITFRAGILHETISEWATWKENLCYITSENSAYQVRIEAGNLNAIVYVLLHEATHVVDEVLKVSPTTEEKDSVVRYTPLTREIWEERNMPVNTYKHPLLETTRFRSGKPIPISQAPKVYAALKETPFVSLYGMASWNEDLAELMSIYHLTEKLNQPFKVSVIKNGKEIYCFEPMANKLVKARLENLGLLYNGKPK